MAVQRLAVVDGTQRVGTLTRVGGDITFTYADAWRSDPVATPVSVSLPLTDSVHGHDRINPWLWGLLPDDDRVLSRWGRLFQTTPKQPLGLLAAVGRDLPGRFQIVPEAEVDAHVPSGVEWLTDDDVAHLLREVRVDRTAWLGSHGAAGRWSLAGAQAKIALRYDGRRWGRPFGRSATTHILKPAIAGLDEHDLNEHLCLQAARGAGLLAARSHVIAVADERAICIERYDRVATDVDVARIHQEDLCQALGVHPDRTYEADGGPSVAVIGSLLTRSIGGDPARQARARFADALALNWLLAGPDAHAKNYSLLLSGGQVRLAPLYDVASALPYPDFYPDKLRLAMRIGGQYLAARVTADHWPQAAAQLSLDEDTVLSRVARLAEQLPAAMASAAAQPDVAALDSPLPQRLLDLVAQRCAVLGRRLA
jgi:serine/threonine-protein kinase HipA